MVQVPAVLFSRSGIVSAVHQVGTTGDPCGGKDGGQIGNLTFLHRGGGAHTIDRDAAIGGVDVQLVADPGVRGFVGISFCSDIGMLR